MKPSTFLYALAAPLLVASAPLDSTTKSLSFRRQSAPVKPTPCERDREVSIEETEELFEAFAQAFVPDRNISEAFTYIAKDYINHNPDVANGSDAAWDALSTFWPTQNMTLLGTAFNETTSMSWVYYRSGAFGEVIDRFRWEGGCIVEHWDQNETFPIQQQQQQQNDDEGDDEGDEDGDEEGY